MPTSPGKPVCPNKVYMRCNGNGDSGLEKCDDEVKRHENSVED